ncbi:hypothetical protein N478_11070 [Pseudoalteromonas luteoviolacea S4060-1]|uniref:Uncharacterized protein n=1 Tax=Pseudoalteromonas luteoviolacea S4060-1 TaxID=1365257 RepID=A0A167NYS0_9GAMM|nr:hypothetical protein N478_11070 [Pseudoalteromonas luteoviolacea S4060-1]
MEVNKINTYFVYLYLHYKKVQPANTDFGTGCFLSSNTFLYKNIKNKCKTISKDKIKTPELRS